MERIRQTAETIGWVVLYLSLGTMIVTGNNHAVSPQAHADLVEATRIAIYGAFGGGALIGLANLGKKFL